MPLLHVGPLGLGGDCGDPQRELISGRAGSNIGISAYIVLLGRISERRRILERFRIGLVPVPVLVEQSVPTADRHLPVSVGIPGKADAGSGIEQVTRHATYGDA